MFTQSSCSVFKKMFEFNRLVKSTDYELKYKYAEKYFLEKKYDKALKLLEEQLLINRGTERGEKVSYYYAKSNYEIGDYEIAKYFLAKFVNDYPLSSNKEECAFLKAYCYYIESPKFSLDQSNTVYAIEAMQNFVDMYPNSNKIEQCNKTIDELRAKLSQKEFESAKHYFDTENYKSSVITFNNILKTNPSTIYREQIMYLLAKSHYLLAEQSIDAKKAERYEAMSENYLKFVDNFPTSKYKTELEELHIKSTKRKQKFQ